LSGFNTCRSERFAPWRVAFALVFLAIAMTESIRAERALSQYIRDEWERDRGYPGGPAYGFAQTPDGYLWIAAERGLVRFDGLTFRLFEPRGSTNVAGPTVLGVAAASDGSLWARLRGPALMRYDGGAFENILSKVGPPESVVSAMVRGRDDTMLLATLGRGAVRFHDGRFETLVPAGAMGGSSFVVAIAETRTGEFWLGTRDAGLLRVENGRVSHVTEGLPDLKVNCLLPQEDGELWIGTDKGVVRWTGSGITRSGIPLPLQSLTALAMTRDRASNVWIAAGPKGLVRANDRGVAQALEAGATVDRYVAAVFEDRDGNLWVGTDRGIERWRDPIFTTYSTAQGLPPGAIGPVYVDEAGRAWFGPTGGGLYWIQDGVVGRVTAGGLDRDVIYSIDGAKGEVWVGRQRGGVTRLRPSAEGFSAEHFTRSKGLSQDSVFAVSRARDGALWAGTLSGGVSRVKNGVFTTYDTSNELPSNTVASILEGADGAMWFATSKGLTAWSRGGWRIYTTQDGLPSNDVNTVFEDRESYLWVGTTSGAAVIRSGQIHAASPAPPALRGSILGFAEDRSGALWISTVDRIVRVNREALLGTTITAGDVREYGVADGLLALESVKRHRTIVADSRGRIWVTRNRGISVADPALADQRSLPAIAHVEAISADGMPVDVRGPVSIPSSRRRITFGYAGLSLSVPERVMYRYRLDGFDPDWSEPAADPQAAYTNLNPGHYRFRVIASNSDGLWNGVEATMPFEIRPTFWQTRTFQALVVLLGGLSGWGLYRLRLLQVARQLHLRFEERLAERTRIAQELHDTLLQGFVSASMQLHVAADRLPEDSPAKAPVGRVLDLMARVIEEGRNAVRGLRSTNTEPYDLENSFAGIQQELAIGQDAAFRVIVEGKPRRVSPAVRDEIYWIGREGLVNAFRHAQAANVELELEYGQKEFRLFVRDDGRGIDPQVLRAGIKDHWGITGMRERAERIGGTLKIRSRAAAGAELELHVPGRSAFDREGSDRSTSWLARAIGRVAGLFHVGRPEKHP
jgi:signal transduction histidine kinase